ncbi:MAG: hypothetical protein IJ736_07575, partial [Firmicutes bacterium]|nr:hypothetical protein [Bacillota bacterium]
FKGLHKYASKYFYDYSELKSDAIYVPNEHEICTPLFNTICRDPERMFKNVLKLKSDILAGKLGKNIKSEFSELSKNNISGGFSDIT